METVQADSVAESHIPDRPGSPQFPVISGPKGSAAAHRALPEVHIVQGPGGGPGARLVSLGGAPPPPRYLVATPRALRSEPVFMAAMLQGLSTRSPTGRKGSYALQVTIKSSPMEGGSLDFQPPPGC